MNILLIESFYSGSHKQWADQLKSHSKHQITLMTLEGKFWKWRMYGSCVSFAEQVSNLDPLPDLILTTDMLDVATFIALIRHSLPTSIPIVTYFHENQFAYPWQPDSEDIKLKRDVHFGMTNYTTALASDYLLFNSKHNLDSFLESAIQVLGKMPDAHHTNTITAIQNKSTIMPLGFEFNTLFNKLDKLSYKSKDIHSNEVPIILWNHRLDHDKNPEDFFDMLIKLHKSSVPFQLALLGEQTKKQLAKHQHALEILDSHIIHMGYCTGTQYSHYLEIADLLPVTSIHDFFGISIAEAIYADTLPLLPKRLAYVDLYKPDKYPELFYDTHDELFEKAKAFCLNYPNNKKSYRHLVECYDWAYMIKVYDRYFESILEVAQATSVV